MIKTKKWIDCSSCEQLNQEAIKTSIWSYKCLATTAFQAAAWSPISSNFDKINSAMQLFDSDFLNIHYNLVATYTLVMHIGMFV